MTMAHLIPLSLACFALLGTSAIARQEIASNPAIKNRIVKADRMANMSESETLKNQTLRFLKKDAKDSGKFLLIEPHLLYLSERQSQAYLSAMKNTKYSSGFHSPTVKIIENNLDAMFFTFIKEPPLFLKKRGLTKGSKIVAAVSYRYTTKELRDLLDKYFSTKKMYFSNDGGTVVALCD